MFSSRSLICLLVFALIAVFPFIGLAQGPAGSGCACTPDDVLLDLAPANQADLPAIAAQYGLIPTPLDQVGTPPTYRMRIDRTKTKQTPLEIVQAMVGDTRISQKETNRTLTVVERRGHSWTIGQSWAIGHSWAIGGSSKGFARQYFPSQIRLPEAHKISTGNGVIIAVLDTGIDLQHPLFAGRLVPGYDFVDNDSDPSEVGTVRVDQVYGHGTHVAGIIALTAPDAKIMPIRVLDSNGEGDLWRVKDAMLWAAKNGATIINMSFGYPQDLTPQSNTFLHDLFNGVDDVVVPGEQQFPEFDDSRLLIVAGAGNGGEIGNGSARIYPAAERGALPDNPDTDIDDNLLSVGASTRLDRLAPFSTMANVQDRRIDRWVRVVAPGENIVSAMPGGRYGVWNGTSMSAPIVAGIAALIKSANPTILLQDLVERIEETGHEWDCQLPSRNIMMETSRVDALCALTNNEACAPPRTVCSE